MPAVTGHCAAKTYYEIVLSFTGGLISGYHIWWCSLCEEEVSEPEELCCVLVLLRRECVDVWCVWVCGRGERKGLSRKVPCVVDSYRQATREYNLPPPINTEKFNSILVIRCWECYRVWDHLKTDFYS